MSEGYRDPVQKAHRTKKVVAKDKKVIKQQQFGNKKVNGKGFSFKSAVKAQLGAQRTSDRLHRKEHGYIQNRLQEQAPAPFIVVVVGPPGCGKTTLIKGLVRHYTKQPITNTTGPITVVTGKKRRVTFIECPNDISAMVDCGKIADLALLMVDASFGFEMETFEFLNVLKTHGFPKVIGVLSHLDKFQKQSQVKKIKSKLKHRFWSEIVDGAKLFYLSGLIGKNYPKRELINLARFISVTKFRPLLWKNTHPFVLVDRYEDLTDPAAIEMNPKIDRTVALFGFVRGTYLKPEQSCHLLGVGDYVIDDLSVISDPIPMKKDGKKLKRSLNEKEKLIYAPMADIGDIVYDKDAIYVDIKNHQLNFTSKDALEPDVNGNIPEPSQGPGEDMVRGLQSMSTAIDERLQANTISLFANSGPVQARASLSEHKAMSDEEEEEEEEEEEDGDSGGSSENEDSSEDDEESELDGEIRWKNDLKAKAASLFKHKVNVMDLVYNQGASSDSEDTSESSDGELFVKATNKNKPEKSGHGRPSSSSRSHQVSVSASSDTVKDYSNMASLSGRWDVTASAVPQQEEEEEEEEDDFQSLRNRFVTGDWSGSDDDGSMELVQESDGVTVSEYVSKRNETPEEAAERRLKAKQATKDAFDTQYDAKKSRADANEDDDSGGSDDSDEDEDAADALLPLGQLTAEQKRLNNAFNTLPEQTRFEIEGAANGKYVRVVLQGLPCELLQTHNDAHPLILGGLLASETKLGLVQCRFKRHRWYKKKQLKTNDPLIFSVGWRRFQSLPIYALEEKQDTRLRFLKYTPEHGHCIATFYGPLVPPNTGLLALQHLSEKQANFRTSGTGVVIALKETGGIVKKLKLTGTPYKVHKHTAYIKDMFSSDVEVAKFEGAAIRTVSGIRGQIKRAVDAGGPPGTYRATFEDVIKMSDIVFCRTWAQVKPHTFYNPVTNNVSMQSNKSTLTLTPADEKTLTSTGRSDYSQDTALMRTLGDIRRQDQIPLVQKPDSEYRDITERKAQRFAPMKIPAKLQQNLPFKLKPKGQQKRSSTLKPTLESRRAVITEPAERKRLALLQAVQTIKVDKSKKRKRAEIVRSQKKAEEVAKKDAPRQLAMKERAKQRFVREGKEKKRKLASQ